MSDIQIFSASLSEGTAFLIFLPDEVLWMSTNATIDDKKIPIFFKAKVKANSVMLTCEAPESTNVDILIDKLGINLLDEIVNEEIELTPWEGSIILESDTGCIGDFEE
jgi:hypothetical protein